MDTIKSLNILPIDAWLSMSSLPLVIAGPCSAESERQMINTARGLAEIEQVRIFRAGIWKPRTRPDVFEGVGSKGLDWLKKVKMETRLLTAVEVAKKEHIEEALRSDVDVLWIGARTVINPFSIQEISDVLKGVDIPVMVKNPVAPDLNAWIGALERLNEAGIRKLVAIHRGFYHFEDSIYRNIPMWEIPIELKRLIPHLPLICDPSHIGGKRELIFDIAQKAMDLKMDGLMIESHFDPDKARTDALQQILPADLKAVLSKLVIKQQKGEPEFESRMEEYRAEIDRLDDELIRILSKRMDIVREIGKFKEQYNITVLQLDRWSKLVSDRVKKGVRLGINRDFLIKLFTRIHQESIDAQTDSSKNNKQ
jgi:chorismate mutase